MSSQVKSVVAGTPVPSIKLGTNVELRLSVYQTKTGNVSVGFYLDLGKNSKLKSKDVWINADQAQIVGVSELELVKKFIQRGQQIGSTGHGVKKAPVTGSKHWVNQIVKFDRPVPTKTEAKPTPVANTNSAADAFLADLDGFNIG